MANPRSEGKLSVIPSPTESRVLLVRRARLNLTKFAARHRVSRPYISQIILGRKRSPRLERALAQAVGLSVEEFFPEHYGTV